MVDRDAGSIASAHARLLGELLDRGHSIDLYAAAGWLPDPGLRGVGSFRFRTFVLGEPAGLARLDRAADGRLASLRGMRFNRALTRELRRAVPRADADDRYDAVLALGTPPPVTLPGRPAVVWPQGVPGGELEPIRRRRRLITEVSGGAAYWRLRAFYEARDAVGWRWLRDSWVIAASQASRAHLIRHGVGPERVDVIPYPIDLDRFRPAVDRPAERRILALGRLDPRKRIDLLVEAVRLLSDEPVGVDVVGRPAYVRGWDRLVTGAGAPQRISYRPQVPQSQAATLLRRATALVQTSENEEFGHAVAEALACGVPVVVGPTNGTREYVPEDAGVVFASYTPPAVAEGLRAVLRLAQDPGTRAACRRAAERSFDVATIAGQVEELLWRATAGAPS